MKKFLIPFLAGVAVILLIAAQPKIGTRAVVLEQEGMSTNITIVTGKSVAATNVIPLRATANRPAFISSDGAVTNASGTPDGTKFVRDDGVLAVPSGGEATTNGIMQPFDVSKTWLVFMGDSIGTTVGTAFVPYSTHATNFPWWQGVAFCTNLSVGGDTFFNQTNNFIVNTLPLLPAIATNGTNVIITIQPGINDFKASATFANMKTGHVEFVNMLHSRGYTVVRTTILPSEPMNDTLYGPLFQFNNWVRTATNYFDRVADFARTLPDNSNLEFYTNDFIHPITLGSYELAKEWDTSVRYMTKHPADLIDRLGHTWEARDHDGTFRLSIGSEFWGSNSVNGIFFTGDLSANQVGIFMTNSGNQDLIYNVANAQAHIFREGNAEILRLAETGLTTPMLTLTGTGDSVTTTGLVFNNAGGTGNDVGIWRDTDNISIHYKAGQGGFAGIGHTWYLGDTQYLTVRLNGAYANAVFTSVAPTNTFSGYLMVTNGIKVGLANQATITNILSGSATLDFGSTSSGAVADLAITVTGAASGDVVSVGVPQGSATGIIGSYSGFASNNTVFVRFVPTAATQDPASGTFKVLVTKFQ